MISIKQYAKEKNLSERTARKQLDRMLDLGEMERMKGPNNSYVYYKRKYEHRNWHDPFNKTKVARSLQKNQGQDTEVVESTRNLQNPEEVAAYA
jgi:hypothetical protein